MAPIVVFYGGSVCESNTPATSKIPPAVFEDRDDHRTACASVSPSSVIGPDSELKGSLPNLSTPPIARAASIQRNVLLRFRFGHFPLLERTSPDALSSIF